MNDTRPVIGYWLRARSALFHLWGDRQSRRDRVALLLINIRSMIGFAYFGALIVLCAGAAWHGVVATPSIEEIWKILCPGFAAVAVLLGATLYAPEQKSGTFELLWLACGSGAALLRLKMMTLLVVFLGLAVPVATTMIVVGRSSLPLDDLLLILFFLITNAWLILGAMAWIGTKFNQAWTAGLLGAAFFALLYLTTGSAVSSLNLFLDPFARDADEVINMNRILVIVTGFLLLRSAARRLTKAF